MPIKALPNIPAAEITPQRLYVRRREFLQAIAGAAAVALNPLRVHADAFAPQQSRTLEITSSMVTTTDAPTPFADITSYNNFYEFGVEKDDPSRHAGEFRSQPWSVDVDGECAKPGRYALEDLLRPHPLEERVYRMRCVEGWSMVIPWEGFPLGDLLKRFEPNGNAKFVQFTTVMRPKEMAGQRERFPSVLPWPYTEGLRMDEAMHPLTIIAVGVYGAALLNQNGAPLRLVVPWKYGFKGIKSIVRISFVRKQPLITWQNESPEEYGFYSNVNPNVSRVHYNQAKERRIGDFLKRDTLMFNGYGDQVASMYSGMDLRRFY